MSNQFSITCNRLTTYFQEQSAKLPIPPALTAQAAKMMLAANSLFNFVAAGASRVISVVSNGKYLDGKSTLLFAQAKTDFAKAGAAGLAGFALLLVTLVAIYKKTTVSTHAKPVKFMDKVTIPKGVEKTLNQLFEGSEFPSIEMIPAYTGPKTENIRPKDMKHTIEKGIFNTIEIGAFKFSNMEYRPFIAIKIKTDFSKCTHTQFREAHQNNTKHEDVLILVQHPISSISDQQEPKFVWKQQYRGDICSPTFFNPFFTSAKDGSLLPNQKEDFEIVQRLIRGEAIERKNQGLTWEISKYNPTDLVKFMDGVTIPSQIMQTLNSLLGQSSVEDLPNYPYKDAPARTSMTAPVMKGICNNRPYLIIQVKGKIEKTIHNRVIILGQKFEDDKNSWTQLNWGDVASFIRDPFAYDKEGNLIENQAKAIKEIGNIISSKGGVEERQEKKITWYLATQDVSSKMDKVD